MTDLLCRCVGQFMDPDPCEEAVTQEDGLCGTCRVNRCEDKREEFLGIVREAAKDKPEVQRILERRGWA